MGLPTSGPGSLNNSLGVPAWNVGVVVTSALGIEGASHGIALTPIYALPNKNVLQMLTNVAGEIGNAGRGSIAEGNLRGGGLNERGKPIDRVAIRRSGVTIRAVPDPVVC